MSGERRLNHTQDKQSSLPIPLLASCGIIQGHEVIGIGGCQRCDVGGDVTR